MSYSIVGPPSTNYAVLLDNANRMQASDWYLLAVQAVWWAGTKAGVDPAVMAGQCAIETGWGHFGGDVTPEHYNLCGLKTTSGGGFQIFPAPFGIPYVGALAQAHHLLAYAGFRAPVDTPDPRYAHVGPTTGHFGVATTTQDLTGRWATDKEYGNKVDSAIERLKEQ